MHDRRTMAAVVIILIENTDQDHCMPRREIERRLLEDYEISIRRKTFGLIIRDIQEFGFTVVYDPHRRGYYLERFFLDQGEIILLCSMIHCLGFINIPESEQLIQKLMRLTSRYKNSEMRMNIFRSNERKTLHQNFIIQVEMLMNAIAKNRKVTFDYCHYWFDKELHQANTTMIIVEPRYITFANSEFYLVVTGGIYPGFMQYRMDRIINLRMMDLPCSTFDYTEDAAEYAGKQLFMFSGENISVTFRCANRMLDYVIDQFGRNVILHRIDKEHFEVTVSAPKTGAILFCYRFLDEVTIIYPEELRKEIHDRLITAAERFQYQL
ncbi:MAG: WYL domain-containing protein [Stecheria intestinalis]|nr:WYL domain-containing protein [Stecheria intestinalis]